MHFHIRERPLQVRGQSTSTFDLQTKETVKDKFKYISWLEMFHCTFDTSGSSSALDIVQVGEVIMNGTNSTLIDFQPFEAFPMETLWPGKYWHQGCSLLEILWPGKCWHQGCSLFERHRLAIMILASFEMEHFGH